MRLRKERNILNNNNFLISTYKAQPMNRNKNSSMDIPQSSKTKNLYLNKILQKNLDPQKANIAQTNMRENIPNFQSSVQSILGNEEKRQKAKNFVLTMRSKRNNFSPNSIQNDYNKDSATFSNTYYDKFYNPIQKSNYELPKENIYRNNNSRKEKIYKPNDILYSLNYDYGSSMNNVIKVNKANKYYDENPNPISSRGPSNIYKNYLKNEPNMNRNNSRGVFNLNNVNNGKIFSNSNSTTILRNSNTNYPLNINKHVHFQKSQYFDNNIDNLNIKNNSTYYLNNNYNDKNLNKLYLDENEFKENLNNIEINFDNHLDSNSIIEKIENNNTSTGLKEIIIDNINELYHNPEVNTHQFELNEDDTNKYTKRKTYELNSNKNNNINLYKPKDENNNNNENIYKKYINDNNNYKIGSNNNTKNKPMQKYYTKVNINPLNRKNDKYIKYNLDNKNSNLKIEKNRIKIISENKKGIDYNRDIMQKIKNRFIQNIKAIKLYELNIKGTNNDKAIKPKYDIDNNVNEINQIKNELEKSKNKNIENEKLLNNYKNLINSQKKELDTKIKEITKIKNDQNANEQKMKNELNDAIKKYEHLQKEINTKNANEKQINDIENKYNNIIKINDKLTEENKALKQKQNELQDEISKLNLANKEKNENENQNYLEELNKLKEDYDNIADEYKKVTEKIDIFVKENEALKNENNELKIENEKINKDINELNKLKDENDKLMIEINNLKEKNKDNDDKNEENNNLKNENEKLKSELDEIKKEKTK
jgi:hypothetical protein